ncbi:uncharacterized protein LOC110234000 isoform X2 [Exaiptasia diaphana]|uniref:Uncharacterized protein n=1 Tax=Exaiptasia diaphana TaxID=2652724 RepID=A0A913YFP1_EXADI|nr:uncharacterized protein LOC110234000 isoform X2 [Exaiptasia diaphana]
MEDMAQQSHVQCVSTPDAEPNGGIFPSSIGIMADEHRDEILSALIKLQNYKPIGFVNEPEPDGSEPMHYMWSVQMKNKVAIEVYLLNDVNLNANQCEIKFILQEREVKRETIESKPAYSRLQTDICAEVQFTIQARCDTSKGARFRVVVRSDIETKSKDYNCLFMREPPKYRVDRVAHPVVTGRH